MLSGLIPQEEHTTIGHLSEAQRGMISPTACQGKLDFRLQAASLSCPEHQSQLRSLGIID